MTKFNHLKNEIKGFNDVKSATVTGFLPIPSNRGDNSFVSKEISDDKKAVNMQYWAVDYDYLNTFGMEIEEGRFFKKEFPTDSNSIIINETAAKLLGFKNPVGEYVRSIFAAEGESINYKIIGVVKNFHFNSLKEDIGPLSFYLGNSNNMVSVRIAANIPSNIDLIENMWKQMAPGEPFNYSFLNEDLNRVYASEKRTGIIFISFAVLAIAIACLGLFGLITYTTEQRKKEIGIRKVLGASLFTIVNLLSTDFLKLVLIAAVIAFPLSWWAMKQWLEDFAYRVDISWWVFVTALVIALFIALLTISLKTVSSALTNPVKNLKVD